MGTTHEEIDLASLKHAVETASVALMVADKDHNITYINEATRRIFEGREREFRQFFPGFSAKTILGSNIDIFHKDPAHQRRMLADPRNLPHKTQIQVGDLHFALNVTAIFDADGKYSGNTVEWNDITAEVAAEAERAATMNDLAQLKAAADGASVALMMCDNDFNISYANEATVAIMRKNEAELRKVFPTFSVDKLVGTNMDTFHKNPAHQRRLLADENNLPYKARMSVGTVIFEINASLVKNHQGERNGFILEWQDVTESVAAEAERAATMNDLAQLKAAADGASVALMMCDNDYNISYANEATVAIMRKNEAELRKVFPTFSVDKLIGTNMDTFHKNPAHQRRLLADENNLPYEAQMTVGTVIFKINASLVKNHQGERNGFILEWQDVTDEVAAEKERTRTMNNLAQLKAAADGASVALMIADADFNINYMNDATAAIMRKNEAEIRSVFPSFSADRVVGSNMDIFHKDPSHQRRLLSDERNLPYRARMSVGAVTFEINASIVKNHLGENNGFILEWKDMTDQLAAESSLETLIDAASRGDLAERFATDGREGFIKQVGDKINTLLQAVATPLDEVRKVTEAVAEGKLTLQVGGGYEGDFGALASGLNRSIGNLQQLVGQISNSSGEISRAAGEISAGNSNLSSRTQEQAAAIEETAATVEELTSTVKQNAENARHADQLASSARDVASAGGKVVTQAVEAMSEINRSSKRIADIISVIDEIAFQTNLLALNAAVEAARAGDQGRGFAVVATEVRNLAQRSANAAREIKTLIKDSLDKVEDGSKLVDRSGATLEEIVSGVKKVSDIVAEIAAASDEQASGIEQVNQAISQMDDATQQNAALVEEAAAAAVAMDEQTKNLQSLVSTFEVSEGGAEPVAAVAAAPTRAVAPKAPKARTAPVAAVVANGANGASGASSDEWEEF